MKVISTAAYNNSEPKHHAIICLFMLDVVLRAWVHTALLCLSPLACSLCLVTLLTLCLIECLALVHSPEQKPQTPNARNAMEYRDRMLLQRLSHLQFVCVCV